MRPDVAQAFDHMAAAARRDGVYLIVVSGFRSDAEQARLFAAQPAPQLFRVLGRLLARGGSPAATVAARARAVRARGRTCRGRLRMCGEGAGEAAEDEPLGLTPRERRCLALVAADAPNRGIGRQRYMAEKTGGCARVADLAKLDVRPRTEVGARRPPPRARHG
jgi:DNA-binding NarL/FixJ family response regulator